MLQVPGAGCRPLLLLLLLLRHAAAAADCVRLVARVQLTT
jgi:hypothetical protein